MGFVFSNGLYIEPAGAPAIGAMAVCFVNQLSARLKPISPATVSLASPQPPARVAIARRQFVL